MNPPRDPTVFGVRVLPSGFWIEVVLGDGSVRYRWIMENPIFLTFEGINPVCGRVSGRWTHVGATRRHRIQG